MAVYEVFFAVKGYLKDKEEPVGNLEYNGMYEENGVFFVKDGRVYYDVEADSPIEALDKAENRFDDDDFGDLIITGSKLKHIRLDNRYWYSEDLYEKPSVDVYTELVKDLYELAEDVKGKEEDDKVVTMLQVAASIIDTLNVKLELAEKEIKRFSEGKKDNGNEHSEQVKNLYRLAIDLRDSDEIVSALHTAADTIDALDARLHEAEQQIEKVNAESEKWIPCSEKLPKAGRFYIVTVFDGEDDYRVEPAYYAAIRYSGQPNVQPKWWTDMADTATLIEQGTDKVVAWQPLPEKPYIPKELEQNEDEAESNAPRMTR